jgi:hypothetical protein
MNPLHRIAPALAGDDRAVLPRQARPPPNRPLESTSIATFDVVPESAALVALDATHRTCSVAAPSRSWRRYFTQPTGRRDPVRGAVDIVPYHSPGRWHPAARSPRQFDPWPTVAGGDQDLAFRGRHLRPREQRVTPGGVGLRITFHDPRAGAEFRRPSRSMALQPIKSRDRSNGRRHHRPREGFKPGMQAAVIFRFRLGPGRRSGQRFDRGSLRPSSHHWTGQHALGIT